MGRARREYGRAHDFAGRGVPVVVPLAWGRIWHGLLPHEVIVYPFLENATDLAQILGDREVAPAVRRDRMVRGAELVRAMHDAGFSLVDLHPGQVLFPGGTGRPVLIDPERSRPNGAPWRWRVRNLVRFDQGLRTVARDGGLAVSRATRQRLLRAYLGADPPFDVDRGALSRDIERRSERRLAMRDRRRARRGETAGST